MEMQALRIFLGAAAAMLAGSFWYSPQLFGKAWMRSSGIDEAKIKGMKKKGMGKAYGLAFLICVLISLCLAVLIARIGIQSPLGTVRLAGLLWAGFVVPPLFCPVLWEGKPLQLFLINAGHYLVALILIGLILVV